MMVMMKCSWVTVVTCIFGFISSGSAQCSDDCYYWYNLIPGNLTCNSQRRIVEVGCSIYAPNSSIASVSVKWYRSESEQSNAEQVASIQFDTTIRRALTCGGLVRLNSNLILNNFSEEDNGYYVCQIVVNNTCLQPSPPGLVQFTSTEEENCVAGLRLNTSPICAVTLNPQECPAVTSKIIPTLALTSPMTTLISSSISTAMDFNSVVSNGSFCHPDIQPPYCYIMVIGSPAVVATILILFIFLPICLCLSRRRRKKRGEMDADSAKTARIQGARTDITEDNCCEDDSEANSFSSATSNLGFVSAPLHVPSYYPPPPDGPPTDLYIVQNHNKQHLGDGPNMHHVIRCDKAEKNAPAIMEGRGDVGVTPNDEAATSITTSCNTLQHEYINTSLQKIDNKDSRSKNVRYPPIDEDGYDTVDYNSSKEGKDLQHDYDAVFFKRENSDTIPVKHNYDILENEKEQHKHSTDAKTHTLVVSNKNSGGSKNYISDKHGIVVEAGGSSDSVTNSKEPNKSGFLKYSDSSSTEESRTMPNTTKPHEQRKVDTIKEGHQPPPRGTTYSTELKSASEGPSNVDAMMNNLFDDPAYDTVDSTKSTLQTMHSSISETSSVPKPSICGVRQNEVQEFDCESNGGFDFDLTGGALSKVQRIDCEMTEDFQPGDISELEPSMTGNASDLNQPAPALPFCSGVSGKESEGQETIIPSSHETFETGGSCDIIYEFQILNLNSKPHSCNEQYEMKAHTLSGHSHDMYEPTSHKPSHNTTPSSMFDDPMYGFGLNLSKTEDK